MSEQSPPPKPKPGSLRDRIAAFENKNAGAAPGPAPAPVPRPKPGGLQWKPKVPSPPSSPDSGQAVERKVSAIGGMSASDAMESIGRGGTLKERMAALQGKGAFGAASPPPMPPKPAEKPKWKPPPAVVSPPAEEDPKEFLSRDASRSPPLRSVASPSPEIQRSMKPEGDGTDQETEGGEVDPEEEERQRRANIAARMARLGGARVGMGPPVFAPKPVTRKPASPPPAAEVKQEQVPADETKEPEATSLPQDSLSSSSLNDETTAEPEAPAQEDSELVAGDSAAVGPPAHTRAPASMPVPAGPRRAAPPRKKAYKSAPAAPLPEPPNSEAEPETAPAITDKEPVTDVEQLTVSPPAEFFISGDVQKEVGVVGKSVEETYDEHLNIKQEIAERTGVVATEHPLEPVADTHEDIEVEEEHVGVAEPEAEEESTAVADDEQAIVPKAPEVEVEDEDEDARRKRVAAKLAQMGAFNPFAGPPPIPRRESIGESKVNEGLDVEDEVNVDVEEVGETVPSPPVLSPKEVTVGSVKHVDDPHVETKAGEEADGDEQVSAPVDRDDEPVFGSTRRVLYHPQADEGDGEDDGRTSPSGQNRPHDDEQDVPEQIAQPAPITYPRESDLVSAEQPGTATGFSKIETGPEDNVVEEHTNGEEVEGAPVTAVSQAEHGENEDERAPPVDDDEMAPPRITRPIPPPPVNNASKPSLPSTSPPLSPPPRTSLQVLKADEEDRAASPDIPPRPVPPPVRSSVRDGDEAGPPAPPRRSVPPVRRASVKATEPTAEVPVTPPPVSTSPRPRQRPTSPPIITTIALEHATEESEDEDVAAPEAEEPAQGSLGEQPDVQEDEESARRRTIAERMARLGGIRFGAPAMPVLSRPAMPPAPPPTSIPPDESETEVKEEQEVEEAEEEDEAARKQRIASKLAGMGGMRFGMLPPAVAVAPPLARRLVSKQEDSENEDAALPVPAPAPSQRAPPTRKPPPPAPFEADVKQEREQNEPTSRGTSDDGVQVEAEESEIEEVHYSDAEAPSSLVEEEAPPLPPPRRSSVVPKPVDVLPTPPPRMTSRSPPLGRPPIPSIPATLLNRRPSIPASSEPSSRKSSVDYPSARETPTSGGRPSESAMRPQSEYVMVEAESDAETEMIPSPPPRRSGRVPPHTIPLPPPPPPSAIEPPEELASSGQWELPSIPQGATEFGDSDLASSGWSEDSTVAVHVPPPVIASPSGPRRPSSQVPSSSAAGNRRSIDHPQPQLSAEDLMTIWGKIGVRVVESATALFEKSKRSLVGDGSYAGFVRAVLAQVSGAKMGVGVDEWGYVIYAQTGGAVQRRVAEIMPGDVIAFWDAKLKGHKGLHAYSQTVGAGESGALVGVVSDFESKKSKVRVWQANQHVGQQTVENVSYRLEDLRSGHVKVFRVLEA